MHTSKLRLTVGKGYVVQNQAIILAFWTFQFRTLSIMTTLFYKNFVCMT